MLTGGAVMRTLKKYAVCFAIGGVGYGIIELIWRRRTHWTMIIAGGICFVIFSLIEQSYRYAPLLAKASLCALGVTAVELVFGVLFNLILKMNVWDYSKMPFNILGQICPLYTLLWGGLSVLFLHLAGRINKAFEGQA